MVSHDLASGEGHGPASGLAALRRRDPLAAPLSRLNRNNRLARAHAASNPVPTGRKAGLPAALIRVNATAPGAGHTIRPAPPFR